MKKTIKQVQVGEKVELYEVFTYDPNSANKKSDTDNDDDLDNADDNDFDDVVNSAYFGGFLPTVVYVRLSFPFDTVLEFIKNNPYKAIKMLRYNEVIDDQNIKELSTHKDIQYIINKATRIVKEYQDDLDEGEEFYIIIAIVQAKCIKDDKGNVIGIGITNQSQNKHEEQIKDFAKEHEIPSNHRVSFVCADHNPKLPVKFLF